MKIHHLNCGCMCPWMGKVASSFFASKIVCHCLLIEAGDELVLVDSGLGVEDLKNPSRIGPISRLLNVQQRPEDSAFEQVKKLGYDPKEVRHIIPTHLDTDHAGGIADFPWAKVHVLKEEYQSSHFPKSLVERERYRRGQWTGETNWQTYSERSGESWFGFEAVRDLVGLPPEILFIPLPGHTKGHMGIAVKKDDGWLFHVGDAYYQHNELYPNLDVLLGWKLFEMAVHDNRSLAKNNLKRLQELNREKREEVKVFCSHDLDELNDLRDV